MSPIIDAAQPILLGLMCFAGGFFIGFRVDKLRYRAAWDREWIEGWKQAASEEIDVTAYEAEAGAARRLGDGEKH